MKLIYHDETVPRTYEEVYESCQKGYGIKRPNLVSGFNGFFFRVLDVYAYGKLEEWIESNEKMSEQLMGFIARYCREDYGFVTRDEYDLNGENRWFGGSCRGTIARYAFEGEFNCYGGVVLEFFDEFGLMYSIEEDMREVYAKQYGDARVEKEIRYCKRN